MAAVTGMIFGAPTTSSISSPVGEADIGGTPGTLGLIYGWDGDVQSHEPIVVPVDGTAYSWSKAVGLVVQGATDTNITNRQIMMGGLAPVGMHVYWESRATFPSQGGPVAPTISGFGAAPGDFTGEVRGDARVYDSQPAPAVLGRNGNYVRVALGVDYTYSPIFEDPSLSALPPLILSWDETA